MATSTFGQVLSVGKAIFEAGMHAFSAGIVSSMEGNADSFGSAALSGLISSLIASGVNSLGINYAQTKASGNIAYNGFGQNHMKAVMVVSGGFSGGISATIAGGNFWQGFRQGIITAGLNHVAHMVSNEFDRIGKTREEIRDVGVDPDAIAPNDNTSVDKLLTTKTLSELNSKAGNPCFVFDNTMAPGDGAITSSIIDEKRILPIRLNGNSTNTYYKLYGFIGHELIHAIDTVSGMRLQIYNQFIKNGHSDSNARKYSGYWSESNAYNWNMQHTPSVWYNQWYNNFTNAFHLFQLK